MWETQEPLIRTSPGWRGKLGKPGDLMKTVRSFGYKIEE